MIRRLCTIALLAITLFAALSNSASADPLDFQKLKFLQLPLNGGLGTVLRPGVTIPSGAPFPGHDELSTAWLDSTNPSFNLSGDFMADDFADTKSTPVLHVQWWGSYMNNSQPGTVPAFLIAFESDVPAPATGGGFSHPGSVLSSQLVARSAAGTPPGFFTETPVLGYAGPDGNLFQYNAELALPFNQAADTVYWLKIVALDPAHARHPGAIEWGWHDRDWGIFDPLASPVPVPGEHDEGPVGGPIMWHFQDDAVTGRVFVNVSPVPPQPGPADVSQDVLGPTLYIAGIDYPTGLPGQFSKDLAFALYTIPEPSSVILMGLGALALALTAIRRRRAS